MMTKIKNILLILISFIVILALVLNFDAIAKKLKEDEQFVKLLYGKEINICSPKWILKNCTDKIVDLVLKEKKKEEREISICVNEIDSLVEEYIYKFAKEFKRVNIITNHIGKFRKIEEKLYIEEGILLIFISFISYDFKYK